MNECVWGGLCISTCISRLFLVLLLHLHHCSHSLFVLPQWSAWCRCSERLRQTHEQETERNDQWRKSTIRSSTYAGHPRKPLDAYNLASSSGIQRRRPRRQLELTLHPAPRWCTPTLRYPSRLGLICHLHLLVQFIFCEPWCKIRHKKTFNI